MNPAGPVPVLRFVLLIWLAVWGAAGNSSAAPMTPAEQARFEALTDKLFAPCCYAESVRVHRSEVASEMRAEIAALIAQGKSDREILDVYVQKYGQRVLMVPEGGKRRWLFLMPVIVLVLGALVVIFVLRRMKRPAAAPAAVAGNTSVEIKDSDLEW